MSISKSLIQTGMQDAKKRTETPETARRKLCERALRVVARSGLQSLDKKAIGKLRSAFASETALLSSEDLILCLLFDTQSVWEAQIGLSLDQGLRGDFALIQLFDGIAGLFRSKALMRGRLLLVFELSGNRDRRIRNAVLQLQTSLRTGLVAILEDGIRSGHFPNVDVESLAMVINCACRGMGFQWALDPQSIDVKGFLRELENTLTRRLESSR